MADLYGIPSCMRLNSMVVLLFVVPAGINRCCRSTPRDANQHFLAAVQCDLLTSVESRGS
jgi:hypothetical protein